MCSLLGLLTFEVSYFLSVCENKKHRLYLFFTMCYVGYTIYYILFAMCYVGYRLIKEFAYQCSIRDPPKRGFLGTSCKSVSALGPDFLCVINK
jgi:hypothetical protein